MCDTISFGTSQYGPTYAPFQTAKEAQRCGSLESFEFMSNGCDRIGSNIGGVRENFVVYWSKWKQRIDASDMESSISSNVDYHRADDRIGIDEDEEKTAWRWFTNFTQAFSTRADGNIIECPSNIDGEASRWLASRMIPWSSFQTIGHRRSNVVLIWRQRSINSTQGFVVGVAFLRWRSSIRYIKTLTGPSLENRTNRF